MKRRGFLTSTAGAGLALSSVHASGPNQVPALVLPLEGEWRLQTDPSNLGREQRWYDGGLPGAKAVRVPSIIQEHFPGYHGVAWYASQFQAPPHPYARGRYLLRFWAVEYLAQVWVNGGHAGGHEGGEAPFVLDVTERVKSGGTNRLAVRVLNPGNEPIDGMVLKEIPHRNKDVPYMPGRSFNTGGIPESVELILAPPVRVEDLFVRADLRTGAVRLRANLRNASGRAAQARVEFRIAPSMPSEHVERELPPGDTAVEVELQVKDPHLWDLDDPYLYQASARLEADGAVDEQVARFGFRDFRVLNGYFRLNGRRLFVRSTHTCNHAPIGQIMAPRAAPDLLRRDIVYAKASGFNMVRFIAGVAHPYQLDLCDEIGLMVYQESYASWELKDSPKMAERFDRSVREMILRDRNHPSVVIWGLLNETRDDPVFRRAVSSLPMIRQIDDTRLVLLGSGRWDCQLSIGSVSNPGGREWEHVWGQEAPGAAPAPTAWNRMAGGYFSGAGDAHVYPGVPQTAEVNQFLRTLGQDSKPVFLSEYGIGSLLDAIREARRYEQAGADPSLEDFALMRSMAEQLERDWQRFGMDGVYPFPEDLFEASQRLMARQRLLGFDLIRSNPKLCGFNLTGMLDHGMTGEGLWRFWREWKPGIVDALQDGWAPLRWCLFVDPTHGYAGAEFRVQAVLANEDVLTPGEYPVKFRISGPHGVAWERAATVRIPGPAAGGDPPLAAAVLDQQVRLDGPAGKYSLVASMQRGGAPFGRRAEFHLSGRGALSPIRETVALWGTDPAVDRWLRAQGASIKPFPDAEGSRRIILVGDVSERGDEAGWQELLRRVEGGSVAVFLAPRAFRRGKDSVYHLPLKNKGRCYEFSDWLYHKECVAKAHPVFDGLAPPGIMDWDYYGPLIPRYIFEGLDTPEETVAAAFAVGYSRPGGYASGLLVGAYRLGAGRIILNTLKLLENLDAHPAAGRIMANLVRWAGETVR